MSSIANHHTGGGLHLPRRVAGGGGQDCGARGASIYTGMDRELDDRHFMDILYSGTSYLQSSEEGRNMEIPDLHVRPQWLLPHSLQCSHPG